VPKITQGKRPVYDFGETAMLVSIADVDTEKLGELNSMTIRNGKCRKKDLREKLEELAKKLENIDSEHNFSINPNLALKKIWNLEKAEFFFKEVNAYYFDRAMPVIFEAVPPTSGYAKYLILAPEVFD